MTSTLAINGGTPVRKSLLPYGRQSIQEGDVKAVSKALVSDFLTTGPQVAAFEQEFAAFTGAAQAVAVSSGTTALHCSMYALGIKPGDEVIVPSMTFIATANAVRMQGGTVVIADTDPDSLLIDPKDIERKITDKTRAVIAVDYAGQPCDYDELQALCNSNNLHLIDDSCHSLGAEYKGRKVGTLADMNIFSFHPVKAITTGEGGMITTDNSEWADAMRKFRNHGISKTAQQRQQQDTWMFEIEDLGYNYRLTDFQCALGRWQLKKFSGMFEHRQKIAKRYDEAFADLPVTPVAKKDERTHGYHLYMIMIDTDALTADRKQIFEALRAEGIGVNVHYIPVHMHETYRKEIADAACPTVEKAYERLITLPLFADMTESDTEDVITAVKKVCSHYAL